MTPEHVHPERIHIQASDGFSIAADVYARQRNRQVAVIHSATGVPQQFYRHFACHLAQQDFTVVTYDYRGIGDSRPASLRGFVARMRDWSTHDMNGVLTWVARELQPSKTYGVGHSFGGQTLGMVDDPSAFDAVVTVSAQSGYWGLQGGAEKYRVALAVYAMLPLLSRIFGYFPWRWFASGEDLPKGVALEWARWWPSP